MLDEILNKGRKYKIKLPAKADKIFIKAVKYIVGS